MKVVTWNCNGALRNKILPLEELRADIYIIQECEDPQRSKSAEYLEWAGNYFWVGNSKNKGLGVFLKNGLSARALPWTNIYEGHEVKLFLPIEVDGWLQLLGVWTLQNNSPTFRYIGQFWKFWKYLNLNRHLFRKTIIAGDLNSNCQWDVWDRWWNHSDVVGLLNEQNIISAYHSWYKELQGEEGLPTFFHQKNLQKPYHIDYIFASQPFIESILDFEVGRHENWLQWSDQMPLCMEFEE